MQGRNIVEQEAIKNMYTKYHIWADLFISTHYRS